MPLYNFKKVFKKAFFVFPKVSIESHDSAPLKTAKIVKIIMSINKCFLLRFIQGSSIWEKCLCNEVSIFLLSKLKRNFTIKQLNLLTLRGKLLAKSEKYFLF